MSDKEAFFVVVVVEHPERDTVRALGGDFAGLRFEDVDTEDFDPQPAVVDRLDANVGLAEDHEEIAGAGRLEIATHMQVGVHPRFEHRHAAELVEFGGVGVVVEGAGDQRVEARVASLARGGDEIGARD